MKVIVKKDLDQLLGDGKINKGDIIEVEHYSYGTWYMIIEPSEYAGTTIRIEDIEILVPEEQAYGTDCRGTCE